jgi:hypothetical protein
MAGPERGGVRHAGGRIMLIALTRLTTRDDRDNRDRRFWAWWPGDPDLGDLERDTVLFSTMIKDDRVPHQQGLGRQLKAFSICVQKRVSADPAGQGLSRQRRSTMPAYSWTEAARTPSRVRLAVPSCA